MPQRESAIVGRNNVRAQVTGQEELLVKVNSIDPSVTLNVNLDAANDEVSIYGSFGGTPTPVSVGPTGAVTIQDGGNVISVDTGQLPGSIGKNNMSNSLSVTLANNELGIARTTNILRPTGSGNVNSVAATFYSVSVANVGAANGSVLGGASNIKPGEVLNFSADAVNNYFTSFAYDATGTEFIIIYVA